MSYREELRARVQEVGREPPRKVETKKLGTIYVRVPRIGEMDEAAAVEGESVARYTQARVLARLICDVDGELVFDVNDLADVKLLADLPAPTARKIIAAAAGDAEGN